MLKLIIHCGLHKTATTSFQKLCNDNRSLLRSIGLHYPPGELNQHSYIMRQAQHKGIEVIGEILDGFYTEAADCHSVLLSGEDFENCIVDIALASSIEALARKSGFNSVTWLVVTREPKERDDSLYSEISKGGAVLSRELLQQAAMSRGCIYVTTTKYNHIFVLDYSRFSARFKAAISGNVIEWTFEQFVRDYPGASMFELLLTREAFACFQRSAVVHRKILNPRFGSRQVEANYLTTALGLECLRRRRFRPILMPLIWLRTRRAKRYARALVGQSGSSKSG